MKLYMLASGHVKKALLALALATAPLLTAAAFGSVLVSHVDHISVSVNNLHQARWFYGEVLQLEEVERPAGLTAAGAWFRVGDIALHIVVEDSSATVSDEHFSLWAPDVYRTAQVLEDAGFAVLWDDLTRERYDHFFTRDPSGNLIEFQGFDHSP